MTSPTVTTPLSARAFLFGDDSVAELGNRLTETGALREAHDLLAAVGDSVWAGAHKELATMADDFLDLDLTSVAIAGLRKHRELLEAAQRTSGTSASVIVPLGTRHIALTQRPRIDVLIGNATVAVIRFELRIDIKVIGVAGTVRDGALVALEGGRCEITATFSASKVRLGQKTAEFDPHWGIPLGAGIRLDSRGSREVSHLTSSRGGSPHS